MTRKKTTYLPDTNVLFNLAQSVAHPEFQRPWQREQTTRYWEDFGGSTRIPMLVWAEFCGLWFHKNVDFIHYEQWFERRAAVFGLTYKRLKQAKTTLCKEENLGYKDIMGGASLITATKMPVSFIQEVTARINKTIAGCNNSLAQNPGDERAAKALRWNTKNLEQGKILDGLDSVIVSFAYEYARKHPDQGIVLVSHDKFMVDFVKYFHGHADFFPKYGIPENAWAALPGQL